MDTPSHRPLANPWLLLRGSLFCNAAAQHFFAAALREGCTPALAAWLNSAVAAAAIFLWLRWRGRRPDNTASNSWHRVFVRHRRLFVIAALAGAAADVLILSAVYRFGPELTAFLANATPAILVLAGLVAGETISPGRLGLAVVAIGGSAIGTAQIEAAQWWGAACVAGGVAGAFWLDRQRWKNNTHRPAPARPNRCAVAAA